MNASVEAPLHVVILGAGPAGLATGHELVANGVAVTVLERNPYVGGLCRTVHEDGYRFDLGGHRWFTKNEDLNNWFRRLMEGELVMVERISRIYYNGKYYMYPVEFGDVIKNAGPVTIVKAGFAFLWAAIRYAGFNRPIRNMKDAYTAQFGSTLYEMFFRRYTEKVWGKPCEELSSDWVSQRSKGLSIWTVAREALSNRKSKVQSLIEEFMYPRDGYMRIPERMAEDIETAGQRVLLSSPVKGIVIHGPRDIEVTYGTPEGDRSIRANHVVSTIPLSLMAQIVTPKADEAVLKSRAKSGVSRPHHGQPAPEAQASIARHLALRAGRAHPVRPPARAQELEPRDGARRRAYIAGARVLLHTGRRHVVSFG